jgi:hypothetical protein
MHDEESTMQIQRQMFLNKLVYQYFESENGLIIIPLLNFTKRYLYKKKEAVKSYGDTSLTWTFVTLF